MFAVNKRCWPGLLISRERVAWGGGSDSKARMGSGGSASLPEIPHRASLRIQFRFLVAPRSFHPAPLLREIFLRGTVDTVSELFLIWVAC